MIEFASTSYTKHPSPFWRQERRILPAGFKPVQDFPVGTKIYKGAWIAVLAGLTCAVVKVAKVLAGGTTTKPRVAKDGYFQVGDTVMDLSNDAKTTTIKSIDTSNPDYDVLTLNAAISTLAEGHFIQEAASSAVLTFESYNPSDHTEKWGEGKVVVLSQDSGKTTVKVIENSSEESFIGQTFVVEATEPEAETFYPLKTLAGANAGIDVKVAATSEVVASPLYVPNTTLAEDEEFVKERYPALSLAYDAVLLKDILPAFPAEWLIENGYALKSNPNIKVIEQ